MNLNKILEFFNPIEVKQPIHIVGCGAIGSTLAEMLARMGLSNLHLYDFDVVTPHNITNQMFYHRHIDCLKTEALTDILEDINPAIKTKLYNKGWVKGTKLSGYVFLCVDNIELRKEIVETNIYNTTILAMFDFRMRLTDAQHYAALWKDAQQKKRFLETMQFTSAEAAEATPVNACGTTLNIAPTVRSIVSLGASNFINLLKGKDLSKLITMDSFHYMLDAY